MATDKPAVDLPRPTLGATTPEVAAAVRERADGGHAEILGEIYPKVDIRSTSSATRSPCPGSTSHTSWARSRRTCRATTATSAGCSPTSCRRGCRGQMRHLPRRRRYLLDGWLGGRRRHTALNAVWGVMHHLGGATDPTTRALAIAGRISLRSCCPANRGVHRKTLDLRSSAPIE